MGGLRVVVASMVGSCLVLVLTACGSGRQLAQSPLAVVLHQDPGGTRLSAVDLESMKVVRSRRLRSAAYSMDSDGDSRVVVTAQAGGVGPEADDAAGVWDLESDRLRYIRLPYPNPGSVAIADGRAWLLHGVQVGDSLLTSSFEAHRGGVVQTGTVSEWTSDIEAVGDEVYAVVSRSPSAAAGVYSTAEGSLERLGPRGDVPPPEERTGLRVMRVVSQPARDALVVVGAAEMRNGKPSRWVLRRSERSSGRLLAEQPANLRLGAYCACVVGNHVAVADADGMNLDDPGREVVLYDLDTLDEHRRFSVEGMASAVAAWNGRVLVFDGVLNRLSEHDPKTGSLLRKLELRGRGLGNGEIEVIDASGREGERTHRRSP